MERIPQKAPNRDGVTCLKIGSALFFAIISVTLMTKSFAAESQKRLGSSSTGFFGINFVVYPSLNSVLQLHNSENEDNSQSAITTDILNFNQPASLCVTGRGVSHFSLTASMIEDVSLIVSEHGGRRIAVAEQKSWPLVVENNCKSPSRMLTAHPLKDLSESREAAVLVIHAE